MSCLAVCRLCLAVNTKMHIICDTPLQEVYEKLTSCSLYTSQKPVVACYICLAHLQSARALMLRALKADAAFTEILNTETLLTEKSITIIDRASYKLNSPLTYSQIEHNAVGSSLVKIEVKEEPKYLEIEKKELDAEQAVSDSPLQDQETLESDQDETKPIVSDSEDDLPLTTVKMKKNIKRRPHLKVKNKDLVVKPVRTAFKMNAKEILLSKEEQISELRARATSINFINSPFKCELCYKGFVDVRAYENHRGKHDENIGPYECDICRMRYSSLRQLRTHAATSHGRRYECPTCQHRAHTANQAREHERWHNGHVYECQLCSQKFRKPTTYLSHMRKRHPTENVCNICGESFVGKHGLLMHKSKTHRGTEVEEHNVPSTQRFCEDCNIQFKTLEAWKRHILTSPKHTIDSGGSQCRICGEHVHGSAASEHARQHERELRESRPQPQHANIVAMACEQCGMNFVSRSKLQAHVKRTHLGLKYNKDVVCEICGKHCTSYAALRYHQRTHSGEKPYTCASCPKRFADRNQLRIHTRVHTGERPYCCASCGRRFSQKPALNRHSRVHTGAKPYTCQFCTKTFSQSNSLKLHVKTVHLKLPLTKRNKIQDVLQD